MNIFEATAQQINQLDDAQLTSLLDRLLVLEAEGAEIPVRSIEVGLNIRAADGGIDASIRWTNGVSTTNAFPSRFLVFQCKAEEMTPSACAAELVASDGTIKPLIAEAFDSGATYILFTTQLVNSKMKRSRIEAMRNRLISLKHPNAANAQFLVYSAEDIMRWVNRYLPAIAYVQSVTGFSIVRGLKSWTEWNDADAGNWPFRITSTSADLIEQIRGTLAVPRRAIRLNGLPGLGKTRLVLEALGPNGSAPGLYARTVYYNAAHSPTDLPQHVIEWVRHGLTGLLVVDNCLPDTHAMLEKEIGVSNSQLSLITISTNPSEDAKVAARLVLKPCQHAEVQKAAQDYIPGLSEADAGKIAHLAGGFIFFAYLLCDAYKQKRGVDEVLVDGEDLLRFLGRAAGAPDDDALRTIEACSIFESVEYSDGVGPECDAVLSISEVSKTQFHRHLRTFIRRGVIEETGRFVRVRPHPLALRLSRNWWEGITPQRAMEVFESVPESMVSALCDRLRMLDSLPEARDVAAKLCGPCYPFGQAEVLFSERGARIFRALAEISPESGCNTLHTIINAADLDTLRGIKAARREWVWALTKLIFRQSTYSCAVDTLVQLALAENESYSNNATGTLLDTFQVMLPGTEVPLKERAEKLGKLFDSDNPAIIALALQAADRAMRGDSFSRMLGAEEQGGGPALEDYEPRSFEEVSHYWLWVFNIIKVAVESGRCEAKTVMPVLASHLRGFIRAGAEHLAKEIVETVVEWGECPWEEGVDALGDALRYDVDEQSSQANAIGNWIENLSPARDDIPGQLAMYISRPSWSDISEASLDNKVKELAARCAAEFEESKPHLRSLFVGEQRAGFAFGYQLAQHMNSRDIFFDFALAILRQLQEVPANLSFLTGFARASSKLDGEATNRLVEHALTEESLRKYASEILSNIEPNLATLKRFVRLVSDGHLEPTTLERFSYGQALGHLKSKEVADLILEIGAISDDAAWVALEIGYMSCHGRTTEMWPGLRDAIQALLTSGKLTPKGRRTGRPRDMHAWEECVLKVLRDADDAFAENIALQIVTAATARTSQLDLPAKVAKALLRSHASAAWPIFSAALLGDNAVLAYTMGGFLGRGLRGDATEGDFPLSNIEQEVFQKWLRKNLDAPPKAARMLQLIERKDGALAWTSYGRQLVDDFGSDVRVLHSIASNLHSGVSWGPRTPFWQELITLLGEFDNHPRKEVRHWSESMKTSLLADIAREQHDEDARNVGRW